MINKELTKKELGKLMNIFIKVGKRETVIFMNKLENWDSVCNHVGISICIDDMHVPQRRLSHQGR